MAEWLAAPRFLLWHGVPRTLPKTHTSQDVDPKSFIIRTKLRRPRPTPDVLARPGLMDWMTPHGLRLVLVSAPAGYGKTTVLSMWAERQAADVAWLSLDAGDNDVEVFFAHLIATLTEACPSGFAETSALIRSAEPPTSQMVAGVLANELLELDRPLILVLDDYHLMRTLATHDFIDELLAHRVETFTLAIGARRDPPLRLSGLRGRGDVAEVREDDLRFGVHDAARVIELML